MNPFTNKNSLGCDESHQLCKTKPISNVVLQKWVITSEHQLKGQVSKCTIDNYGKIFSG